MTDHDSLAGLPDEALPGAVIIKGLEDADGGVAYGAAAVLEAPTAKRSLENVMPELCDPINSIGLRSHGIGAAHTLDSDSKLYLECESGLLEPLRPDEPALERKAGGWLIDFVRLVTPLVFRLDTGWLVASPHGAERPLLQLYDAPGAIAGPFRAETPLVSWLESGDGLDAPLRERLEVQAAGDAFSRVCGLGASLRLKVLRPPIGPAGPNEAQRALLAREIVWARGLGDEDRERLEDEACAAADLLADRLVEVLDCGAESLEDFESKAWRKEVCELLLQRDELQGLLKMLQLSGAGEALTEALSDLDRIASLELAALPAFELNDVLLQRAVLVAGNSWWTAPARVRSQPTPKE